MTSPALEATKRMLTLEDAMNMGSLIVISPILAFAYMAQRELDVEAVRIVTLSANNILKELTKLV